MSAATLVADVLLWLGVAAELVCSVGVWWMRDVFDRLHYAAAATTLGPALIGASVAVTGAGTVTGTVEAVTATAVLLVVNPLLTHATGRSARRLVHDDIGPRPEDLGEES